MPVVATKGGIRGSLCWMCDSERARKAEVEVLYRLHTDYFSRSFKGPGLHEQKVAINDARDRDTSIDHRTLDDSVEGDRIEAREFGDSLLHYLRIDGVSKPRLNLCTSWGRVRALSNNACNVERPGGVGP